MLVDRWIDEIPGFSANFSTFGVSLCQRTFCHLLNCYQLQFTSSSGAVASQARIEPSSARWPRSDLVAPGSLGSSSWHVGSSLGAQKPALAILASNEATQASVRSCS